MRILRWLPRIKRYSPNAAIIYFGEEPYTPFKQPPLRLPVKPVKDVADMITRHIPALRVATDKVPTVKLPRVTDKHFWRDLEPEEYKDEEWTR
jgi:hypothetical protein